MKKGLIVSLITVGLMLGAIIAQASEERKFGISIEPTNVVVQHMPLSVRDVPVHPDDLYTTYPGPIEEEKYPLIGILTMRYTVKSQSYGKDNLSLGLRTNWYFVDTDKHERNYTNAPGTDQRGYGAALTYLTLAVRGVLPEIGNSSGLNAILSLSPEVIYEKGMGKDEALVLSASYLRIAAETGWDRYDSLRTRDVQTLAHCIPIGIGYRKSGFNIGFEYLLMKKTSLGREAGIKGNLAFQIGARF